METIFTTCTKRLCDKRAVYGKSQFKPEFCEQHNEADMIESAINDTCIGCNDKKASFNYLNTHVKLYCAGCRKPKMVNLKLFKKCNDLECSNHGIFIDKEFQVYCEEHLDPANVYAPLLCEIPNCFNRQFNKNKRCRIHIRVKSPVGDETEDDEIDE